MADVEQGLHRAGNGRRAGARSRNAPVSAPHDAAPPPTEAPETTGKSARPRRVDRSAHRRRAVAAATVACAFLCVARSSDGSPGSPLAPATLGPSAGAAPDAAASVGAEAPALTVRVIDDAGAPLATAHVRAEREDDATVFSTADTDADGVARFTTLAPGRWVLRADAEGAAPAGGVWRVPASETPTLTVHAAGRVGGIVLAPDGTPADGAEISIVGSGIWPARAVAAGADGRFALEGVPPGVYEVAARRASARAEPRRGLAVEAGARIVLSFALTDGASLAGLVLDAATGEPVAGAHVRAATEVLALDARTATSGPDGRFSIAGLAPGVDLHVDASADGFVSALAGTCAPGGLCTLRLERAASLSGVVYDENARPVAGASIEIVGEGTFGTPVRLRSADLGLGVGGVPGRLPVTAEVPPLPIFGEGPHVAPAPVVTHARHASGGAVRTNERGEFVVEGVPAGNLEVVARAAGYAPGRSAALRLAPGERRENVEIVLGQGGRIEGRVVDDEGQGVASAVIEHRSELDPVPRILVTDQDGAFVLEGVRGEVSLRAIAAGRPPALGRVTVEASATTNTTLRLDPAGLSVRGRVVDAHGRPIDGAQVRIESMRPGGGVVRTVTTDALGEFVAERVPAPPLRVVADHRAYALGAGLDVESLEAPVELALARPVTVAGSVLDAWTALGLERAAVSLVSASVPPVVRSVESDEDGRFVVPRLFAGRWTLELAADGHVSARSEIVVRASRWEEQELPAVSLEPGARIEGDVVDRLGQVTAGVLVEVAGDEEAGPRARTDERGHFVLDGLGPGEHVLALSHPSAGEADQEVTIVRGREPSALVAHLPGRAEGGAAGAATAPRRGVPLEVALEDGAVVVTALHGRLAALGVLPGDALEAVDGESVGDLSSAETLLAGAGPAVLTLVRGGERFYLRADRRTWTPR